MSDIIPMSRTGYDKLKAELEHMDAVEMPKIAQRIAAARSEGDLSENAEYHGARESQAMMQAKINLLRDKLSRSRIVDPATLPKDEVVFGTTVVVKDLDFGDTEEFTLVGTATRTTTTARFRSRAPWARAWSGTRSATRSKSRSRAAR